jgi:RNA polymerase sigma-70 factor, ECF subfamily
VIPTPVPEATVTTLADADVVRRVVNGDVALFEILIRRYNPRVFRAVLAILRDATEAEDTMQQAWLSAYAHLGDFQQTARFSTWLTRIAINEATHRRGRSLRVIDRNDDPAELVMNHPTDAADPEARAASSEAARILERAVDQLPDPYRAVFMLREVEGMDTAECAASLSVSEEVVKTRLHRARLALRKAITEQVGAAVHEAFSFGGDHCDRITRAVMARLIGPR